MICNIVDHRKNKYQWAEVWGVVEPTWHDNRIGGASKAARDGAAPSSLGTGPSSLSTILTWAAAFRHEMTLFLYDNDPMA